MNQSSSKDLLQIMNEHSNTVRNTYAEGTFTRLFWDKQLKAASVKNPRQTCLHPVLVKWCLSLQLMSSATYHALSSSGFIKLPPERTSGDYTNYFENRPGFQDELNKQLTDEIEKISLPQSRKLVGLILDEMKVKEGLVYNKHNGEILDLLTQVTLMSSF